MAVNLEPLREAVRQLSRGASLNADPAAAAVAALMSGEAPEGLTAAFLMGLRVKGRGKEPVGCARAMRAAAVRVAPRRRPLVDTCGTGGDRAGTFHISTLAALVAAGADGQVIGVFDPSWCRPVARAAGTLGVRRALVVHGSGGVDELTLCGPSRLARLEGGEVTELRLDPRVFGLERLATFRPG